MQHVSLIEAAMLTCSRQPNCQWTIKSQQVVILHAELPSGALKRACIIPDRTSERRELQQHHGIQLHLATSIKQLGYWYNSNRDEHQGII